MLITAVVTELVENMSDMRKITVAELVEGVLLEDFLTGMKRVCKGGELGVEDIGMYKGMNTVFSTYEDIQ